MELAKSLNQSPQGGLEKIGYKSSNGPPRNCCKVSNKYLIGYVLGWQNGGLHYDCWEPWITPLCPGSLRCMRIYPRLSKSIIEKPKYSKNNIDTIENINLENNVTYLWFKCSQINFNRCRILQSCSRSRKHHDLPPNDSSLNLGTEMVEISRLEVRVLPLNYEERMIIVRNPKP